MPGSNNWKHMLYAWNFKDDETVTLVAHSML